MRWVARLESQAESKQVPNGVGTKTHTFQDKDKIEIC